MEKARIVLYDDLVIIDETETFFTDSKNLESIVISCLRTTPGALIAEVYVKDKLKSKMTLTNKGKPCLYDKLSGFTAILSCQECYEFSIGKRNCTSI